MAPTLRARFNFAVPNVIEPATTGRAACRGCGQKIPKGELRFGESIPNAYAEGETTVWFHMLCAACARPAEFLEIASQDHAELRALAEEGVAHRRLPRLLAAERAPSGRARCRSCHELMDKGAWRLRLGIVEEGRMNPIGFIHVGCSEAYFETRNVLGRIERLTPELSESDRAEIGRALGPGLAKTSAPDGKQSMNG